MNEERERIRMYLREVLDLPGWSKARMAREAEIAPSTLFRALESEGRFVMKASTLGKIEAACGVPFAGPGTPVRQEGAAVILHQMPNGKARLQINTVLPFSVALQILALVQGEEK